MNAIQFDYYYIICMNKRVCLIIKKIEDDNDESNSPALKKLFLIMNEIFLLLFAITV